MLSRDVENLDNVRTVMGIQQDIREKESEIDSIMVPIEHVYDDAQALRGAVPAEETEEVDTMKQTWGKMNVLAVSVGENLQRLASRVSSASCSRRCSSSWTWRSSVRIGTPTDRWCPASNPSTRWSG